MNKKLVVEIICLLFVLLFVYAAVSKLTDVDQFAVQIGQSPLLEPIVWVIVWTIPAVEIIVAVFLVIPRLRLVGLFASFGLMVVFTAYIVAILQFSEHIPCSCGGVLQNLGWVEHLLFNGLFIALAVIGIFMHTYENKQVNATLKS